VVRKCASAGTGTYGARVDVADRSAPADFLRALVRGGVSFSGKVIGQAVFSDAQTPPPPPPPPPGPPAPTTCEVPPKAELITKNAQPHLQVSATCTALAADLDYMQVDVPKEIRAWDAHSTSCSATVFYLVCVVKPDGRVCMHILTDPPSALGDLVRMRLRKKTGDRSFLVDETGVIKQPPGDPSEAICAIGS